MLAFGLAAYAVNVHFVKPHSSHWFLHGQFNDVLAVIVLLSFANMLGGVFRHPRIAERPLVLIVTVLAASLHWELIAPLYRHSVCDPLDCLAYATGGIVFLTITKTMRSRTSCSTVPSKAALRTPSLVR